MILVAILGLSETSTMDAELPYLAADLGVAAYDARLLLAAGFPAVVLSTADRDRALALLGALRGRGHRAAACDASAIASSSAMISLKRFQLEEDAVIGGERRDARLPYDDILCLLRAWHRHSVASEGSVTERKFDPQRAIVSGGMMLMKNVSHRVSSKVEAREEVLYVFRRSAQMPWILRESGTLYASLGEALSPAQHDNYLTTVRLLRAHAPEADYDERLLTMKKVPERVALSGSTAAAGSTTTTIAASSEAGMDVLAHLLALSYARKAAAPYRQ